MDNQLVLQILFAVLATVCYQSRFLMVVACVVIYIFVFYLIENTPPIADIRIYVSQLNSGFFYKKEYGFGLIQQWLIEGGWDGEQGVKFLQISLAVLFLITYRSYPRSLVFVFSPFFFIFTLNSIRQGFAAALLLIGVTLLVKNKRYFGFLFLFLSTTFHLSALLIVLIIAIYYVVKNFIIRIPLGTLILLVIGLLFMISLVYSYFVEQLGYGGYIRVESFEDRARESSTLRIIFFAIYGLVPLTLLNLLTELGRRFMFIRAAVYMAIAGMIFLDVADGATRIGYYFMVFDFALIGLEYQRFSLIFKSRLASLPIIAIASINPAGIKLIVEYFKFI